MNSEDVPDPVLFVPRFQERVGVPSAVQCCPSLSWSELPLGSRRSGMPATFVLFPPIDVSRETGKAEPVTLESCCSFSWLLGPVVCSKSGVLSLQ